MYPLIQGDQTSGMLSTFRGISMPEWGDQHQSEWGDQHDRNMQIISLDEQAHHCEVQNT